MTDTLEVTPQEASRQLCENADASLIDVRETHEYAAASVKGATLIPMGTVPAELQRLEALSDKGSLLVLCHHGVRSLQVVCWLRERGIENCFSVAGGIDRWTSEVDPGIPRY